jgi:putative DNA primase/helicase
MSAEDNTPTPPVTRTDGIYVHQGQTRMAYRFMREHSHRLRYVHGLGWHVWTGTHWTKDSNGLPVRLVIETVKTARLEAAVMPAGDDRDQLWKDAAKGNTKSGLEGILGIAKNLEPMAISAGALDSDPYLFNTLNGTIDLRTGELEPHNPTDLITQVAGCGYDPEAEGIYFLKFLSEILPDAEVRDYVQRLIGSAMLGKVHEHILPLFLGGGRNGKTKLLEAALRTFGDYGLTAPTGLLVEKNANASTSDKLLLRGKRIVVCAETDEGQRFAASTVKLLTGGDDITARGLYKDWLTFTPSHLIFLMTNHPPRTDGTDNAMFERLKKISFEQTFTGERQDPELSDKLDLDRQVILRWAVEGYQKYDKEGLNPPSKVLVDTETYRLSNDPLGKFLSTYTLIQEDASVGVTELYEVWKAATSNKMTSLKAFSGRIEGRGFTKKKRPSGMRFLGIGLLESATDGDDHGSTVTEC